MSTKLLPPLVSLSGVFSSRFPGSSCFHHRRILGEYCGRHLFAPVCEPDLICWQVMQGFEMARQAFGGLDEMWCDEAENVMENFDECVEGREEEEFEYADEIPFENLKPSLYRDLRVLEQFFTP